MGAMVKIIISPAKKMRQDTDTMECRGTPVFLQETDRSEERRVGKEC